MYNYNKKFYADLSEKTVFQRDILEKVHRLIIILEYINSNPGLEGMLALKGGTAINLTVFNLPRLSVDIDLDFSSNASREEMLVNRDSINALLKKYFESEGYTIDPKSKTHFSLDSWVIKYTNTSGNPDKIKVEINYSLRQHMLPIEKRGTGTDIFTLERKIFCLSKIELLRKCVIFYKLISSEEKNINYDTSVIDKLSKYKIGTDLYPMLRKKEPFDLEVSKHTVKAFIDNVMTVNSDEKQYIERFMTIMWSST